MRATGVEIPCCHRKDASFEAFDKGVRCGCSLHRDCTENKVSSFERFFLCVRQAEGQCMLGKNGEGSCRWHAIVRERSCHTGGCSR